MSKTEDTDPGSKNAVAMNQGGSHWYLGYFLLAVFNIVTISAGTLLNYNLVRQYEEANEYNRYWSEHLADYGEVETLISLANAPGNDVFASMDPRREEQRLDMVLASLEAKFSEMRLKHELFRAPSHSEDWDALLGSIERLIKDMSDVTRTLLHDFEAGDMAAAGRSMAAMDRVYAEIVLLVNRLEQEAQVQQRLSLSDQVSLAERMRNIQYVIGALVGLLVIGVAVYGYRLAVQMRRGEMERAAQLEALEASEHRFRELTEGSIQGIVVHRDGTPLFANDAWARIHGFPDAGHLSEIADIADMVVPEDRDAVRDMQYALQYGVGNSRQYEYRARRKDGRMIWLECLERVVIWQGQPALQATVIDATERKEAEAGLHDAILRAESATSARTRFFAAASHDLRQPLHAISLYLPLLRERMENTENREMLSAIQNSCSAMRSLLDSLLDISRLDAGVVEPELVPVPLIEIFDQLGMEFTPQAAAKGLELRVVPADYWVRSDTALLERILRNLLTNAIRYTTKGRILLGARRSGQSVRVEVWDTGIGIAPEVLETIFEEFYQVDNPERDRSRGLGLGLAIIRRLAGLLEHDLGVRSTPGKGSVFYIAMPGTSEPLEPVVVATEPQRGDGNLNDRLAVLVDDDPIILEGTEAMLADWGCEVLSATSASGAVEAVRQRGRSPDFIVADLRLRGTETGLEAVAAVQDILERPAPAIIVTGDTDPERIRKATASGYYVLHKPVEPVQLRSTIDQAIADGDNVAAKANTIR